MSKAAAPCVLDDAPALELVSGLVSLLEAPLLLEGAELGLSLLEDAAGLDESPADDCPALAASGTANAAAIATAHNVLSLMKSPFE
ncbi:MAG TPA: hypothetical protein VFX09_00050 [Burkholderiales bacterium]|nr:hypothetical protein [Burkholderiales bacterium]